MAQAQYLEPDTIGLFFDAEGQTVVGHSNSNGEVEVYIVGFFLRGGFQSYSFRLWASTGFELVDAEAPLVPGLEIDGSEFDILLPSCLSIQPAIVLARMTLRFADQGSLEKYLCLQSLDSTPALGYTDCGGEQRELRMFPGDEQGILPTGCVVLDPGDETLYCSPLLIVHEEQGFYAPDLELSPGEELEMPVGSWTWQFACEIWATKAASRAASHLELELGWDTSQVELLEVLPVTPDPD